MSDVAALRALHEAATPEPWHYDGEPFEEDRMWFHDVLGGGVPGSMSEHQVVVLQEALNLRAPEDAALIAAMRNALPELLAAAEAVERVKALHHPTVERGMRAACVDGDCDCPPDQCPDDVPFTVCAGCFSYTESLGYADQGECWPGEVMWPCPTVRALGGEQ